MAAATKHNSLYARETIINMLDELKRRARPLRPAMLLFALANGAEALCLARLGQDSLLAYSQVLPWLLMLEAIGFALGASAASTLARCKSTHHPSCMFSCLSGTVVLAMALVYMVHISAVALAEQSLIAPGVLSYLKLWRWALPLALFNFVLLGLMRAKDLSLPASWCMGLTAAAQCVLMPILILNEAGDLGRALDGAAYAHVFSQLLLTGLLLCAKGRLFSLKSLPSLFKYTAFTTFTQLLKLALPITLANLLVPLSTAFALQQLAKLDGYYVGAFSLALRVESFLLVSFYAWSAVVGPIAANRLITHKTNNFTLAQLLTQCWHLSIEHGLKIALAAALLTSTLKFWLTECPQSQPLLQIYFLIVPISYIGYGFLMLTTGILNGLGHALASLIIASLRSVLILWPVLWAMSNWPANAAIFLAFSVSNFGCALIVLHLLRQHPSTSFNALWQKPFQQGNQL
ncbi:Na+-driven multidrug efflux pump [Alteromonadaceae bacterium Bs31]|nr:Na+-driven multidrug efflux pump [Alteromonadaceae bacterium Bs31]